LSIALANPWTLQLSQAYQTLSDAGKRREYDLIYPSIKSKKASSQNTQTPRPPPPPSTSGPPPPASASTSQTDNEVARIAVLRKEKEERGAKWRVKRNDFESSISELQRTIRRLEQEIKDLAGITAAEKGTKAHKGRESQERKIRQDLKERRLTSQKVQLQEKESGMKQAKDDIDAADLHNDNAIRIIEASIEARARSKEAHDRRQREDAERERRAKLWQQQQQEQREKDAKAQQQQRGREATVRRQQQEQRENEARAATEHSRKQQAGAQAAESARPGWPAINQRAI
jgi:hypothetical protein